MRKGGISAIVATVLVILITVAAIAIIWLAIIPMISEGVSFDDSDARLEIVTRGGYTFWDEVNNVLHIQVSRGADDVDMTGLRFVVTIGGNSVIYPNNPIYPDDAYNVSEVNGKMAYFIEGVFVKPDSIKVISLISKGGSEKEGSFVGASNNILSSSGKAVSGTKSREGNVAIESPCDDGEILYEGSCIINEFSNEQQVIISGYSDDVMEPFISPDGQYLFFNNINVPDADTDLHYAQKNGEDFDYIGKLQGANIALALDCCSSMDISGNFYFTSPRDSGVADGLAGYVPIIYSGSFDGALVNNVELITDIEYGERGWINGDVSINFNGDTLYIGQVFIGLDYNLIPSKSKFRLAKKSSGEFTIDSNSDYFFDEINGDDTEIEYAPAVSYDELEIYFTRLKISPYSARIYVSTRPNINEAFGEPQIVAGITGDFSEAPIITQDGKTLYYHKYNSVTEKFEIYKVTRY